MPAAAPIQALRVSVRASETISAGITNAAHSRSRVPKSSRATVAQMTSISVPEYVIQCDSVPCMRRPRLS